MTRQVHDQFAKEYLEELLNPFGKVTKNKPVTSERQEIDLFFIPDVTPKAPNLNLGILENIAKTSCLIEPFRNPCTEIEIRSCLLKLYSIHSEILRQAKRDKISLSTITFPYLWILTPTCSQRILQGFGAELQENWQPGVYFLAEYLQTAIIVIHQLPVNQDTLWLRVLGKGTTQQQAVAELVQLPKANPLRANLLDILADWRKNLELRDNLTRDEQEVIMNLSPAYLKEKEEWRQEALLEGKLDMLENLLQVRFQTLDDELQQIIPAMLELPTADLTRLLLTLNREELITRFKQ